MTWTTKWLIVLLACLSGCESMEPVRLIGWVSGSQATIVRTSMPPTPPTTQAPHDGWATSLRASDIRIAEHRSPLQAAPISSSVYAHPLSASLDFGRVPLPDIERDANGDAILPPMRSHPVIDLRDIAAGLRGGYDL